MTFKKIICSLSLMLFSFCLFAQPTLEWSQSIQNSRGHLVRVDLSNNIFTAGSRDGTNGLSYAFLWKHDPSGNQIWNKNPGFGNSQVNAMLLDDSSNLYLAATAHIYTDPSTTSAEALCAKFDSSGNILWTDEYRRNYQTTLNSGFDVMFDGSNGLLFKGGTQDSANGNSFDMIIKYTSGGQRIWLKADSVNVSGCSYKFAKDPSDNIYFATSKMLGGGTVVKLFKYDSNGNKLWQVNDSGSSMFNGVLNVRFYNSFIYVLRENRVSHIGLSLLKYDSNGQLISTFNYEDISHDIELRDFKIASSGNVYIFGNVNQDVLLIQVLNDTTIGWVRTVDGGMNKTDLFNSAVLDSNENVFITGRANWAQNYSEMFVSMTDELGNLQWLELYHPSNVTWADGDDVVLDHNSNLIVTGTAYDSAAAQPIGILRKYSGLINSINNINKGGVLSVFPNPSSGEVNFKLSANFIDKKISVSIYDVLGQKCLTKDVLNKASSLSLSILNHGMYYYRLTSDKQEYSGKFIVH